MSEHYLLPAAVALLAAALLAYALLRRGGRLEAEPRAGSRFRAFGENIRLRDLYRLAVMMEEDGRAFYLKLAGKAADDRTKKLCTMLAEEESSHRQLFLDMLRGWPALNVNRITWPIFMDKVKLEGFYADPPGETASEEQMAAYAIRQERKSYEFYQLFEEAFPEAWKRSHIHNLILEERSHETKLRAAYPHIP